MFRLIEPLSDQIQNIVLVHSVSACTMGSHTVYKIILNFKIKFYSVSRCIYIRIYIYFNTSANRIKLDLEVTLVLLASSSRRQKN
jgi:hypothetical protein